MNVVPVESISPRFKDLTKAEKTRLVWAFMWRGLIVNVLGAIGGGIAGYLSVVLWQLLRGALGITLAPGWVLPIARTIGGAAGLVVGLVGSVLYIAWVLRSRLGGFRLKLIRDDVL